MVKPKKALKEAFSRPQPLKNNFEANETQFWKEVGEKSESLIANLIEKVLPISAIPSVFDLEKDTDYRALLSEDLPTYCHDNEEYQEKIAQGSWNEADVEYVAEILTCQYFDIVVTSLTDWLSKYGGFENTSLANLI